VMTKHIGNLCIVASRVAGQGHDRDPHEPQHAGNSGGHASKTRSRRMMALAAVPIILRLVACTFSVTTMTVTAGAKSGRS
jgi:hypothetical protein